MQLLIMQSHCLLTHSSLLVTFECNDIQVAGLVNSLLHNIHIIYQNSIGQKWEKLAMTKHSSQGYSTRYQHPIFLQVCRKMEMFLSIGSHDTQDHNWMNNPEGTLDINYFTRLRSFWQFKNVKFFSSKYILTVIPEVRFKFFKCGGLSLFYYIPIFFFHD